MLPIPDTFHTRCREVKEGTPYEASSEYRGGGLDTQSGCDIRRWLGEINSTLVPLPDCSHTNWPVIEFLVLPE